MIRFLLIFVFFFTLQSAAQNFTASVNETTVSDNQRLQVSFTYSGTDINGLKNFKPPSFNNFLVFSGPSQSTSIQIINGVQSGSLSYNYIVAPKSVGTFNIGSASIESDDEKYKTKPIKITVVKGTTKPKDKQQDSEVSNEEIAKNLFIRAIVDKRKVYLGEQVTVTYKLYTRLNIAAQMSISKLPQYQGFWTEELETSNNITFATEVIDGKQFRVGVLKKAALFPTQTGKLEVTPFELIVPIQLRRNRNRNNFFDDFFNDPFGFSKTIEYNATSDKVSIDVIPLPIEDKPESFHGAVGDYSFATEIDKSSAKTNEPITLKVNISGTGNLKLLELPEVIIPSGFEKYEPKTSESINRVNVISGKKNAEYLMVPRVVGKREIPPVEFSYFNPKTKKYYNLTSDSFQLDISQGEQLAEAELTGKENIRQLGEDIRFIKTVNQDLFKKEEPVLFTTFFWVGGIIPAVILLVMVGWKRKNDRLAGNLELLRYRKAQKVARNRLKRAKKLMAENNHTEFYNEVSQALFGYLEDKLNIPKSMFTIDRALAELEKRNVGNELVNEVKIAAEDCEFIRFSPGAEKNSAMQNMYEQLATVIINVEKNIVNGYAK
ncbi:BatD family protein [Bacteroidota bacterium]